MARRTKKPTPSSASGSTANPPAVEDAEIVGDAAATSDDTASGAAPGRKPTDSKPAPRPRTTAKAAGAKGAPAGSASQGSDAKKVVQGNAGAKVDNPKSGTAKPDVKTPETASTKAAETTEGAAKKAADPKATADSKPADKPQTAKPTEGVVVSDDKGSTKSSQSAAKDETAVVPVSPPPAEPRGSVVPLVVGGIIAGLIGFAVGFFLQPTPEVATGDTERLDALTAEIDALRAADAPATVDIAPLEQAQADLSNRLDALSARVDGLPTEGAATAGPAAGASTAAFDDSGLRSEIADLGSTVATVETAVSALSSAQQALTGRVSDLENGLSEANTLASSVEQQAERQARESARSQIRLALQSGAPFAEPLDVLGDAPPALAETAANGVPAQAALIAAFPDLARDALRTARRASDEPAGVGSLFRNAFNPRSLEPREGDDPDAVLSRAEAAVRSGDLDAALTEIEALPEDVQAVLSEWTERARSRAAALSAADDYLQDG